LFGVVFRVFWVLYYYCSRVREESIKVRRLGKLRVQGLCPLIWVLEWMVGAHHLFCRLNIGLAELL
jgi:hypothetical protein